MTRFKELLLKDKRSQFVLKDKAFSLIELVVTVAIVGIIASIAVSQFEEYRTRANDLISLNQLLMARTAVEIVSSENPNSSYVYQYYDDLHEQFNTVGRTDTEGLLGYVHVKDVYLAACSLPSGEYAITSTHNNGTQGAYSTSRGSRTRPVAHIFSSASGQLVSSSSYLAQCIVPARMLP